MRLFLRRLRREIDAYIASYGLFIWVIVGAVIAFAAVAYLGLVQSACAA